MKYKLKYKKTLVIIAVLLIINIMTFIYYGLWSMAIKENYLSYNTSGCTNIIYNDDQDILLVNPKAYSDEDGVSIIPKTITLINNCDNNESIVLYMDVFNDSTISDSKLKVNINGDETLNTTFLNDVSKLKGYSDVINTYKLIKIDLKARDTKRINFRIWLDYNAALSVDKNRFHAKYYILSDKENAKNNFMETILNNNKIVNSDGLIKVDNMYFFNGNVSNNNVRFADLMWKIVGINEDGSIKLIYSDEVMNGKYNEKNNEEKNVSYDESSVKAFLDEFYKNKLSSNDGLIKESIYCNDTSANDTYYRIYYGPYTRNFNDLTPTLKCPETNKEYGGSKNYKIGLISLDEAAIAGLSVNNNENNYLNDGNIYYTMSPIQFNYRAYVAIVDNYGKIDADIVNESREIRPVINLINSLEVEGDGSLANPYLVKYN